MHTNSYDYVKSVVEAEPGYSLVSTEYINNKTPIEVMCDKGHIYKPRFDSFISGKRCNHKECNGTPKYTLTEVTDIITSEPGYKLLSTEYESNRKNLTIQCGVGDIFQMSLGAWLHSNQRCPKCARRRNAEKARYSYDEVKNVIESEGHTLLSSEYINNKTPLLILCPNGHINNTSNFGAWRKIHGKYHCFQCSVDASKNTLEEVKERLWSDAQYTLVSTEYINSKSKIDVRCDKGHTYPVTYGSFLGGNRCPKCPKEAGTSKQEKSLIELVESIYHGTIITHDKTQLRNPSTGYFLELDIWLPEINRAIEYNGNYWHSLPNRMRYDELKAKMCLERNIELLTIDSREWVPKKKKPECVERIKGFING